MKLLERKPSTVEKRNMFIKFVTCTNPETEKIKVDDSDRSIDKSDISEKSGEHSTKNKNKSNFNENEPCFDKDDSNS